MKKFLALFLSFVLCMGLTTTALAAEVPTDETVTVSTGNVSTYSISGYGETAKDLTNTSGILEVPVTVTSGNGYGLTLKTFGSGTAEISVEKPDGTYLRLGGIWTTAVEMNNTAEKAWNFKGIQSGVYKVHYYIMGGPMQILYHIYG